MWQVEEEEVRGWRNRGCYACTMGRKEMKMKIVERRHCVVHGAKSNYRKIPQKHR